MSSSEFDHEYYNWRREAENIQSNYNSLFADWKHFDNSHAEYVKSQVGLILFGVVDKLKTVAVPSIVNYYRYYDDDKREVIENIYKLIMERIQDPYILLSCTYLVCRLENKEEFICSLIRVTDRIYEKTYYFDAFGRCYCNWEDFKENNTLPSCIYLAPKYGIYSLTCTYAVFKSRAATIGKVTNTMNGIAAGGTAACLVASYFALAPITVTATMLGLGMYGIGQSIHTLADRNSHGQSIALDNKQSVFAYGNLVASGLTGASFAAVKNISRIQKVCGTYANVATTACKVLNFSTLVIDSGLFLINTREIVNKIQAGEATLQDAFDLTLQMFLIFGAVVQVRDMHNILKQSQVTGQKSMHRRLTKTQKRNLQKRRAKARARGEVVSTSINTSSNTVDVVEADPIASVKTFALRVGEFGMNVLMTLYSRSELIYQYFLDMRELICNLYNRKIPLEHFCVQFYYHMRNIYLLIKKELENIKTILQYYVPDPNISNNDNVAQVLTNQIDRINEATEVIVENVTGTRDLDELQEDIPHSVADIEAPNKVVMRLVQDVCLKFSTADTSKGLLEFFLDVLMFSTNQLTDELTRRYEQVFCLNKEIVGEEKAIKMVSNLGRKTEDDFYPEKKFFTCVITEVEKSVEEFYANKKLQVWSRNENDVGIAQQVFQCLVSSLENLHSKIANLNELGIAQLTRILQTTCVIIVEKIKNNLPPSTAHGLFEKLDKILGREMAIEMMKTIGDDEFEKFQSALNSVNMIEAAQEISRLCTHRYKPPSPALSSDVADTRAAESIEETLVQITSTFYHRVLENQPARYYGVEKSKIFVHVAYFVAEQFIKELTCDGKMQIQLKDNLQLVGPQSFKAMLKTIGVCGGHESALFQKKSQLFARPDWLKKMVAEFEKYSSHNTVDLENPTIFETTISECGFTTHKVNNCTPNRSLGEYISIAERLFKIKINDNYADKDRATISKECVVIKHNKSAITFTFMPEDKTALVVMTDLSRTDE